jgi:hypothetical protein
MKRNRGTFSRAFNVLVTCRCCGRKTQSHVGSGTDLCRVCFDSASTENEHLDDGPEHSFTPHDQCPLCRGVACLHELKEVT